MSFGYYDKDWVDPTDPWVYVGPCRCCRRFNECACGCGWGYCDDDPGEFYDGDDAADECEGAEVDDAELGWWKR